MKNLVLTSVIIFFLQSILFASEPLTDDPVSLPAPARDTETFRPNPKLMLSPSLLPSKIEIDGVIDTLWTRAARFNNFTEIEPAENRQPEVSTSGYITYDDQNLYVAFVCRDPQISSLRASLTDRDKIFDDDWISISIDPDQDHQKAYQFYVNARGIQGDLLWQANGDDDESFDMIWYSDAKIYDDYWTAEMKIPFESLRFPSSEVQNWSVHLFRQYPRENAYKYSWMPVSKNNNSLMSQAGNLQLNLPRLTSESNTLEILPYAIATQQSYRIENNSESGLGKWENGSPETRLGFGFKYGFSSNFISDFAYNPDFSQIESDAGQINVNNPFALFFQEKRPFFQEGSEIYAVDRFTQGMALDQYVDLFYSRSINDPLVAGKLSGKIGKLSVGYTSAFDQSTPFVIPFEESSSMLATRKKSYNNILRTKADLGNQSSVGFFVSDRRFEERGSNSVAALDASFRLSEKYILSGIAAVTHTRELDDPELSENIISGKFEAGNKIYTNALDNESFAGTLLRGKLQRDSRNWEAVYAYQDFSPGFRADNGFIPTNNYRNLDMVQRYSFRFDDHPVFTFIRPQIGMWRKFNYDGKVKDTGIRTNLAFNLKNQTFIQLSAFLFNRENLQDKQFGDARSGWIYIQNNTFKTFSLTGFVHAGNQINRFGEKGNTRNPLAIVPSFRYNLGLTFKPTSRLNNRLAYSDFKLWTDYGEQKIVGQQILRNSFTYQFTRNMFIRLIGEYNIIDSYSSSLAKRTKQKFFTFDPMFSYKLNAFSVFYLGGQFGGKNNQTLDWQDMRVTDKSLYVKFQYLIRT